MKTRERVITVYVCDNCDGDKDTYPSTVCLCCDKSFCYDCGYYDADNVARDKAEGRTPKKVLVKHYKHGIYSMGSGDGCYCVECDTKLRKSGADPEHNAYVLLDELREEQLKFHAAWKKRAEQAEKQVDKFYKKRQQIEDRQHEERVAARL